MDLYIYYRVSDGHAATLAARVRAMQAGITARAPVTAELKRRPGSTDGQQTWMEIYTGTGAGFDAMLASAVLDAGLAELTAGPRHTEVFTDVASCA